ncbi:uncharacterized protein PV07_00992 [Cladophialophora immunda]|uniref:Uncharacterized protein n=1 Tax=Cladophialophora immunda TaxID=569365 RepID=A0A0D2DES0_9EURO|nr:uncharacterized protein PV07_00992 [Cladophialophora immunda]KIW34199.1 hypothetical protein PV07_00992 [Cladophialophora immunda]
MCGLTIGIVRFENARQRKNRLPQNTDFSSLERWYIDSTTYWVGWRSWSVSLYTRAPNAMTAKEMSSIGKGTIGTDGCQNRIPHRQEQMERKSSSIESIFLSPFENGLPISHQPNADPARFLARPCRRNHNLPLAKNFTGTSTYRALKNSAQFLPRKSTVLVLVAPRSRRLRNKKCTPLRFGNSNLSISSLGTLVSSYSLPKSCLMVETESRFFNHTYSSSRATQKPQLQSDPLSPERAFTMDPIGARSVGPNLERSTCSCVSGWLGCLSAKTWVTVGGGTSVSRPLK